MRRLSTLLLLQLAACGGPARQPAQHRTSEPALPGVYLSFGTVVSVSDTLQDGYSYGGCLGAAPNRGAAQPHVSPDGLWSAWVADDGLHLGPVDNAHEVVGPPGSILGWSPDSKLLAAQEDEGAVAFLGIADDQWEELGRIEGTFGSIMPQAFWSPDSREIRFSATTPVSDPSFSINAYVARAPDWKPEPWLADRQVLDYRPPRLLALHVLEGGIDLVDDAVVIQRIDADEATWSPDGRFIMAGSSDTYRLLDGAGTLVRDLGDSFHPVWLPTGSRFIFPDWSRLYLRDADNPTLNQQLVQLPGGVLSDGEPWSENVVWASVRESSECAALPQVTR